ncbi:MAG: response regulator [Chloroflexota bacterium]|nr:response regulator [Chloroflexota bacterium]
MFGKNLFKSRRQTPAASVLIVSDDRDTLSTLQTMLTDNGFTVYALANVTTALALLNEIDLPDVFICDFVEPLTEGVGFIKKLQIHYGKSALPPAVFLMDSPDDETAASELGVYDVLPKPVQEERLLQCLTLLSDRSAAV